MSVHYLIHPPYRGILQEFGDALVDVSEGVKHLCERARAAPEHSAERERLTKEAMELGESEYVLWFTKDRWHRWCPIAEYTITGAWIGMLMA
jgi:hypothetical protein